MSRNSLDKIREKKDLVLWIIKSIQGKRGILKIVNLNFFQKIITNFLEESNIKWEIRQRGWNKNSEGRY